MSSLSVVKKIMVLSEGTLKAYGPRDEVLAAMQGKPAEPPSAQRPPQAPQTPAIAQLGAAHG
jgi:ATP-binding cassette subfamily C exporter for protease/lipase